MLSLPQQIGAMKKITLKIYRIIEDAPPYDREMRNKDIPSTAARLRGNGISVPSVARLKNKP
jgi:hypothetical protein